MTRNPDATPCMCGADDCRECHPEGCDTDDDTDERELEAALNREENNATLHLPTEAQRKEVR